MRVHIEDDSALMISRPTGLSTKSSSMLSTIIAPLPGTRMLKLLFPSFHQRVESSARSTNCRLMRPWLGGSVTRTRCSGTAVPPISTSHSSSSQFRNGVSAAMPFLMLVLPSGSRSSLGWIQSLRRSTSDTPQCSTSLSAASVVRSTVTSLSPSAWRTTTSRPDWLPRGKTRRNLQDSSTAAFWMSGSSALGFSSFFSALSTGISAGLMRSITLRDCRCWKAAPSSMEPMRATESPAVGSAGLEAASLAAAASACLRRSSSSARRCASSSSRRWRSSSLAARSAASCSFLASKTSTSSSLTEAPSSTRAWSRSRAACAKSAPFGRPLSIQIRYACVLTRSVGRSAPGGASGSAGGASVMVATDSSMEKSSLPMDSMNDMYLISPRATFQSVSISTPSCSSILSSFRPTWYSASLSCWLRLGQPACSHLMYAQMPPSSLGISGSGPAGAGFPVIVALVSASIGLSGTRKLPSLQSYHEPVSSLNTNASSSEHSSPSSVISSTWRPSAIWKGVCRARSLYWMVFAGRTAASGNRQPPL
mmetsp:Transcript_12886/g.32574  ORF Transcript_12886/g.32574 Transcript_12886/m.32574 type:complete len:536 (+) Transcript_12886:1865-3472(+)